MAQSVTVKPIAVGSIPTRGDEIFTYIYISIQTLSPLGISAIVIFIQIVHGSVTAAAHRLTFPRSGN